MAANEPQTANASSAVKEARKRLDEREEELAWLFRSLYGEDDSFDLKATMASLTEILIDASRKRRDSLRQLDRERLDDPTWYRSQSLVGMELYPAYYAGTLQGLGEHLDYFEDLGVNFLYLMAVLQCPPGADDGGFAVSDYRSVNPALGSVADLDALCDLCASRGISIGLDLALNHTSDQHPWAQAARAGDQAARNRYFFFDDWTIPRQYDAAMQEVFPINAPGNFTYLDDCDQVVMTTFYPYQWDLNYHNPRVLLDMVANLVFLANRGASIIRLNTLPHLWKELGTSCRNLEQVHDLVRIMRLCCEVTAPAVALLGEVVMDPTQVLPYFGRPAKPQCHLLYNVSANCSAWHGLATQDPELLCLQASQLATLGSACTYVNYLRNHDDIGWALDYRRLEQQGLREQPHKKYLNEWFCGLWPGSWSKGEPYNATPSIEDARICGTTASLCGIEKAIESNNDGLLEQSLRRLLMLHGWLLSQNGIPMVYSGDEIAQLNDYSYHDNPEKSSDSRYLQRRPFDWTDAKRRLDPETLQGRVYGTLRQMIATRKREPVFSPQASVEVFIDGQKGLWGVRRRWAGDEFTAYFNFSSVEIQFHMGTRDGEDLLSGRRLRAQQSVALPAWGFYWLIARGSNASVQGQKPLNI